MSKPCVCGHGKSFHHSRRKEACFLYPHQCSCVQYEAKAKKPVSPSPDLGGLIGRLEKVVGRMAWASARGRITADNTNYVCGVTIAEADEAAVVIREALTVIRGASAPKEQDEKT